MRYYFLLALVAILALCAANDEHPLCAHNKEHLLDQQDYSKDSKFGQWLNHQYDEWKPTNGTKGNTYGFFNFFAAKFIPDISPSIRDCDGKQICSPIYCGAISDEFELEEQHHAWLALESMVNYNNGRVKIRDQVKETFTEITAGIDGLISDYSDVDNVIATLSKINARYKSRRQMAGGILLLVRSYMSGLGTAISIIPGGNILGHVVTQTGNMLAIGISAYGIGTAIKFDKLKDAKSLPRKLDAAVSKMQAFDYKLAREMFELDSTLTMRGDIGLLDMTLVEFVQTGSYANPTKVSRELQADIYDLLYAQAISHIWNQENVYIIMAPALGHSCADDNRALGKVCLDDWPGYVFYPQFTSHVGDYQKKGRSMVRLFPGHEKIPQSVNLSMTDVVQSSVAIFADHGNEAVNLPGDEALEQYLNPDLKTFHRGGRFAGIFAIPVCYQPDGFGISSINLLDSRNYPCFCGTPPWGSSSDYVAVNSLVARQHKNKNPETSWRYDQDQTFAFLNATGLHQSKNWWENCHNKHGMRCKQDMSVNWKGKFPGESYPNLKHPFNICRGRPHHAKGCDSPNDGIGQCGHENALSAKAKFDMGTWDITEYDDSTDSGDYDYSDDELDEYFD